MFTQKTPSSLSSAYSHNHLPVHKESSSKKTGDCSEEFFLSLVNWSEASQLNLDIPAPQPPKETSSDFLRDSIDLPSYDYSDLSFSSKKPAKSYSVLTNKESSPVPKNIWDFIPPLHIPSPPPNELKIYQVCSMTSVKNPLCQQLPLGISSQVFNTLWERVSTQRIAISRSYTKDTLQLPTPQRRTLSTLGKEGEKALSKAFPEGTLTTICHLQKYMLATCARVIPSEKITSDWAKKMKICVLSTEHSDQELVKIMTRYNKGFSVPIEILSQRQHHFATKIPYHPHTT